MYLIVGLGNPEPEYSETRHNMGFDVINLLSEEYGIKVNKTKFNGLYGTGEIEGKKVILLKPQTYMNLSGEAVIRFINFYKIDLKELIVIYDDIDTEKGCIRIRKVGSSGSHNGIKSVIENIGTEEFCRIRVGLGQPEFKHDMVNYVTAKVKEEEKINLEEGVKKAKSAVAEILKNNVDTAMNKFN